MINNSQKHRISITVDSQLLEEVDRMTKNRSAAVEEGLRLWHKQQIEEQLKNFYQNRSQADLEFEKKWAAETQEKAIAAWEEFPWHSSSYKNE
jgi:hypothetical protein